MTIRAPRTPMGRRFHGDQARRSPSKNEIFSTRSSSVSASSGGWMEVCCAIKSLWLRVTNARVDVGVREVDDQRDDHQGQRAVDRDDHHHRVVLELNRVERPGAQARKAHEDRKSTRLNSSHGYISYAVFCLKKKN